MDGNGLAWSSRLDDAGDRLPYALRWGVLIRGSRSGTGYRTPDPLLAAGKGDTIPEGVAFGGWP